MSLEQHGPGQYVADFQPTEPGVYLVRARSGAEMVSAGMVRNISGEAATGQINHALLQDITRMTDGHMLTPNVNSLELAGAAQSQLVELRPALLMLLLLFFLADLILRRWENVLGMIEVVRSLIQR